MKLELYPNPTQSELLLQIKEEDFPQGTFQLFNLTGKLVASYQVIGGNNTIQLDKDLPVGQLFYRLLDENSQHRASGSLQKY